jgi:hypothetical protein
MFTRARAVIQTKHTHLHIRAGKHARACAADNNALRSAREACSHARVQPNIRTHSAAHPHAGKHAHTRAQLITTHFKARAKHVHTHACSKTVKHTQVHRQRQTCTRASAADNNALQSARKACSHTHVQPNSQTHSAAHTHTQANMHARAQLVTTHFKEGTKHVHTRACSHTDKTHSAAHTHRQTGTRACAADNNTLQSAREACSHARVQSFRQNTLICTGAGKHARACAADNNTLQSAREACSHARMQSNSHNAHICTHTQANMHARVRN